MSATPFKLDNDTKAMITEISALGGYARNIVKEVLEYLCLSWIIKIADNPDDYAVLPIPYLGNVGVKYDKDRYLPTGEVTTDVDAYVELSESFKKLIGDIHDEADNVVTEALRRKIETASMIASAEDEE